MTVAGMGSAVGAGVAVVSGSIESGVRIETLQNAYAPLRSTYAQSPLI